MKKFSNVDYSPHSLNSKKNQISENITSHFTGKPNFSLITDYSYKPKTETNINGTKKNNNSVILKNSFNFNRHKCINTDHSLNNYSVNSQKNDNLTKKIIQRNINNILGRYITKKPNSFNQTYYSKILESIHLDEDIKLLEIKEQKINYFEKIAKEFEIRKLKQKIENLKNKNNDLKEKIKNLKDDNFDLSKNTIFQHYQNKLIILDLINKYNFKELKLTKNKNQKLTFKNFIFFLSNLKIDYENKKLINLFFISIKEMIILSKILTKEEIRIKSNDYIYLINKLISLSNGNPNEYNNKKYYNVISKAMNILNYNDNNKLFKKNLDKPINNKCFYNKNQLKFNPIEYTHKNYINLRNLCENFQKYKNYSIKTENNRPEKQICKNNFHFLSSPVNNKSCNLTELNSSFKRNKVKALWKLKMKNNLKFGKNIQKHDSNHSSIYSFPSFQNENNINKKKKYRFLNENNIINYTDSISINSLGNLTGERYKNVNKIIKDSKFKNKIKNLKKQKMDDIQLNNNK